LRYRPIAWSGRRRIDEAIRCRQLRANTFRRTTHRRLFSAEDADSPWTFSDLVEPSPNRVDHLMFTLSLVGTPDQPLCRPMRCPSHTLQLSPDGYATEIDLRVEGPCFALPVKAIRAKAREHLPSYRESASETHRPDQHVPFRVNAFPRTDSPSLGSCPASGGASSFLLASALV
jgi:hypothetical protein